MKLLKLFLALFALAFTACSTEQIDPNRKQEISFQPFEKRDFKLASDTNPCENFYEYVCKPTITSFELPQTRSYHVFSFGDIKEYLLDQKKHYFREIENLTPSTARERMIKDFYSACMNEQGAVKAEKDLVQEIKEELAGIKTRREFAEFLYQKMSSGEPSLLSLWANLPNFKNSEKMDVYFNVDVLSLPEKSYYLNPAVAEGLVGTATEFFKAIGEEKPEQKGNWVIDFEKNLAKAYPSSQEINKRVFSLTELSEKTRSLKQLQLGRYIQTLPGQPHIRDLFGHETFAYLDNALSSLSLDKLKSVYLFHALKDYLDDAYPEFRQKVVDFRSQHLGSPNQRPDRQERCTSETEEKFVMELHSILLPQLFPDFPKQKVAAMVDQIQKQLIASINENSWLERATKTAAIKKLEHANIRLIAPETEQEWNFRKLGDYSASDIVSNRRLYQRLQHQKFVENLTENFTDPPWAFGPLTVNAALLPPYNAIIFPMAMFLPPFYDPSLPEEVNMAAIGSVIGHELGHMVDDKGYTFDYRGRINPWMTAEDKKEFFEKAQPLIDQFNSVGQNGEFTLGENIGDLVGLSNSYKAAFGKRTTTAPQHLKRDFFIQYGRLWCEVQKPEFAELRKRTDPHALGFARTNEQVKIQPGFADAFNCKAKSAMVLPNDKRVRIW